MATEKRLIDANDLRTQFDDIPPYIGLAGSLVQQYIDKAPTVDAVEVVRCRDCKYWKPGDAFGGDSLEDMQRIGRCPNMRFARREKDFCCEGERRADGR